MHGSSKNPLYRNWAMMKYRSGKGGTELCRVWSEDFKVYLHWAWSEGGYSSESKHLIRQDGAIGFTPANCRFGTKEEADKARCGRLITSNTSGHAGIYRAAATCLWHVQISMSDGMHHIGGFPSLEAAVEAKKVWLKGD